MKRADLHKAGVPEGEPAIEAFKAVGKLASKGIKKAEMIRLMKEVVASPEDFLQEGIFGRLAQAVVNCRFVKRVEPAPWRQWGSDLEEQSVRQMQNACELPVSVAGALMPDAHLGYGLPIGGVLATESAVIPFAVGVDIACRVKMTVLDRPVDHLDDEKELANLKDAIERETRFGIGASFEERREHSVLDEDWKVSPITRQQQDKAWRQLGTSGSGNHFVEFGEFCIRTPLFGLEPGRYLALLSHSGSRGAGAAVASHYSRLAMKFHPNLPKRLRRLAWLDLATEAGEEYWRAMELMGRYASANHACIHSSIAARLGAEVIAEVENHHNFAWRERHFGRDVIVHRKGATPAGAGVEGIIPGSMASPGFVVRGKGDPESMNSAAHGAGRVMSRRKALRTFTWKEANRVLEEKKVTLISAGLDEVPMVYKDIEKVMDAQSDLVDVLAQFNPRLVKMAPPGEKPED
jgi:tRNA-splicing ligase RtcB